MKKEFFLLILFFTSSCYAGYCRVFTYKQQEAQSMYNAFGTSVVDITPEQGSQLFGNCYRDGDTIYVYKTFWGKKYILTHYGEVVTYTENQLEEENKNEGF